jgi:predicted nucleic acid-binding protein
MQYFFDTSAVVKIYHEEEGSQSILPLYTSGESILLSELSKVEFTSTIHKKFRTKEIDIKTLEALKLRFLADTSDKFVVIPIVSSIIDAALELYEKYGKSNPPGLR